MIKFEKYLLANRSDMVVVTGDVTSTMACTIVSKKLGVAVSHVEAGIRSGDMTMPEEINRIVTDSICDHFFTTTEGAGKQLLNSGINADRIHLVGNTMFDTLLQNLHRLKQPGIWSQYNLSKGSYFVMTLHRPSNVDDAYNLKRILDVVLSNAYDRPIIFPVHPRTKKVVDSIFRSTEKMVLVEPMGYLEFIYLVKNAKAVITDSGGITEETTVLKVPCITLRSSTERPETITIGSNELIGTDPAALVPFLKKLELGEWKKSAIPDLWDGKTAHRIVSKLLELS
jgi:UDP-N-acetylglucosamine 2-epimerase (non-hydrolysing)